MALSRFKIKQGGKGKATPHARYITREGKFKKKENENETVDKGHGNMPQWAEDNPLEFWKTADKNERKNGYTYREHEIALPREFNRQQNIQLVEDWIKQELPNNPYQYAIHTKNGLDGKPQPHVHLMYSERQLDGIERTKERFFKRANSKNPEKGGVKKVTISGTKTQRTKQTQEQRFRLGDLINKHLERNGFEERVDMRTLKEQGIDREPLNIEREDFYKPHIQETYKQYLQAKEMLSDRNLDLSDEEIENTSQNLDRNITAKKANNIKTKLSKIEEKHQQKSDTRESIMSRFEQWQKNKEQDKLQEQQAQKQVEPQQTQPKQTTKDRGMSR